MSWILPSETVKEKAREISHLLYGMTIEDVSQVVDLVKGQVGRFSSHQTFAPMKQDNRTREQFLADLFSQEIPSKSTARELAKWSQEPMKDLNLPTDLHPVAVVKSVETSLERRDD